MTQENSYKVLKVFNYEVNAQFTTNSLEESGIEWKTDQNDDNKIVVSVKAKDFVRARTIFNSLELDDTIVSEESDGYTKGYVEWSDRQFDPGYYTGGKTPHYLKDRRNWKFFGPVWLVFGLFLMYVFFSSLVSAQSKGINTSIIIFMIVYLIVGISLTYQAYRK